jgi:hypothetical protein
VSRLSRQCGILNISQPYRPPWPVTGTALLPLTLGQCCVLCIAGQRQLPVCMRPTGKGTLASGCTGSSEGCGCLGPILGSARGSGGTVVAVALWKGREMTHKGPTVELEHIHCACSGERSGIRGRKAAHFCTCNSCLYILVCKFSFPAVSTGFRTPYLQRSATEHSSTSHP